MGDVAPERRDLIEQQEQFGADHLEDVYDVAAEVKAYANDDQSAIAYLTVVAQAPGTLLALGPPYDPALVGQRRAVAELIRVEDAVCAAVVTPPEQRTPDGPEYTQVECQVGDDGVTFDSFTVGLTVEQSAALVLAARDAS